MIIFGYLTGASIGRLFAAGILPGIMIGLSLIAIATLLSRKYGYGAALSFSWRQLLKNFLTAIPALGAPLIILGGILGGIFTATESAAAAVFYSLLVGFFVHRELAFKDLNSIFVEGSVIAAIVMFIIATASIFSWVAAIDDIPGRLAGSLLSVSENPVVLLLLINLVLLIAGTFVETTAALILLVLMIVTLVPSLGIDPVQLGVIVVTNLANGMLTPPMGICLIVSASDLRYLDRSHQQKNNPFPADPAGRPADRNLLCTADHLAAAAADRSLKLRRYNRRRSDTRYLQQV